MSYFHNQEPSSHCCSLLELVHLQRVNTRMVRSRMTWKDKYFKAIQLFFRSWHCSLTATIPRLYWWIAYFWCLFLELKVKVHQYGGRASMGAYEGVGETELRLADTYESKSPSNMFQPKAWVLQFMDGFRKKENHYLMAWSSSRSWKLWLCPPRGGSAMRRNINKPEFREELCALDPSHAKCGAAHRLNGTKQALWLS